MGGQSPVLAALTVYLIGVGKIERIRMGVTMLLLFKRNSKVEVEVINVTAR